MGWEQMQGWAEQHGVQYVAWASDLVGLTVEEASDKVKGMQGNEEFVVHIQGGITMKLKTEWWHEKTVNKYRRWHNNDHRLAELDRGHRKLGSMQVQECRAVVQGWAAVW